MNNVWIGPGAHLKGVVVDKDVRVGAGAVLGGGDASVANVKNPDNLKAGISVIGKGAVIPGGTRLGSNVLVEADVDEKDFDESGVVPDGATVERGK